MSDRHVIERIWQAPLDVVWELWTSPAGIASWFGPKGFVVEVDELDLRAGGTFQYTMRATGSDTERVVVSTVTEVDPPHKFVYDSPMGPETMTTSVEFTDSADGVKMVLVISATKAGMTDGAAMGWESSLERFGEQLA